MKKGITIFASSLFLLASTAFSQSGLKEYTAGHIFKISLPDYMSKTIGLNTASSIEYRSVVKDVYGVIILDTKEELALAEMKFTSIQEFYEYFMNGFLGDAKSKKVSEPILKKIGETKVLESDVFYHDEESDTDIYYLAGIVETEKAFYKVLSWSAAESKDKFKSDFQKILYSLKD